MFRPIAVGACLLLGAGVRSAAQSRRDLEARVARLATQLHTIDSMQTAYADSMTRADVQLVPYDVGPLHLRLTKGLEPLVREAAVIARGDLEGRLGPAATRVRGMTFFVRADPERSAASTVAVGMIGTDGRENWVNDYARTAQSIAMGVEDRAIHELSLSTDVRFRRWLWASVPLWGMTDHDWVDVRMHVVAESNDTAAACFAGDAGACRRGLHVDGAFQSLSGRYLPGLPVSLRASVVAKAIEMGGNGAMERLLSARGSPATVLSATAGAPIEKVIDAWSTSMRDARVSSATVTLSLASTSVLVMLACLGAAVRSPRWR